MPQFVLFLFMMLPTLFSLWSDKPEHPITESLTIQTCDEILTTNDTLSEESRQTLYRRIGDLLITNPHQFNINQIRNHRVTYTYFKEAIRLLDPDYKVSLQLASLPLCENIYMHSHDSLAFEEYISLFAQLESNPNLNYQQRGLLFFYKGYHFFPENIGQGPAFFNKAISYFEKANDPYGVYRCYWNLGKILTYSRLYQEAFTIYRKILDLPKHTLDSKERSSVYLALSNCCFYQEQFSEALTWYTKRDSCIKNIYYLQLLESNRQTDKLIETCKTMVADSTQNSLFRLQALLFYASGCRQKGDTITARKLRESYLHYMYSYQSEEEADKIDLFSISTAKVMAEHAEWLWKQDQKDKAIELMNDILAKSFFRKYLSTITPYPILNQEQINDDYSTLKYQLHSQFEFCVHILRQLASYYSASNDYRLAYHTLTQAQCLNEMITQDNKFERYHTIKQLYDNRLFIDRITERAMELQTHQNSACASTGYTIGLILAISLLYILILRCRRK